jgi:hypothetical protein
MNRSSPKFLPLERRRKVRPELFLAFENGSTSADRRAEDVAIVVAERKLCDAQRQILGETL